MSRFSKPRVAYVVSHPIQYQAPLLRRIAQSGDVDLSVHFLSDFSDRAYVDRGFGCRVEWDVPLRAGYVSEVHSRAERVDFWAPYVPDLPRRLSGGAYDLIWLHGWRQRTQLAVLRAAFKSGTPILLRGESVPGRRSWLQRAFLRQLFARVTACGAVGRANREFYAQHGVEASRVVSMPYGVDNDFFTRRAQEAAPQREELRRELGLTAARPIVLFASKLIERKRPLDLLAALERLIASGIEPRPYLLLAGDGPQRSDVERYLVQRPELREAVRLLGFQNQTELPRLYELCDVFSLPSRFETWGLVVNEVQCASRPVVVGAGVHARHDLVEPGVTGLVHATGDVEALAAALGQLCRDPERARCMGARGFERVQRFDSDAVHAGLLEALELALPGGSTFRAEAA